MSSKKPLKSKNAKLNREQKLTLLRQASEVMDLSLIVSWQSLPMHKRMNFLRVRVPGAPNGGTAI